MSSAPTACDMVIIRDLRTTATVGPDRWGKTCPQLIMLTARVETSFAEVGESDNINDSINYDQLVEGFNQVTVGVTFISLLELPKAVAAFALNMDRRIRAIEVDAYAKSQFLQAECLCVHIRRARNGVSETEAQNDRTIIGDLRLTTIIGTTPPEREAKQTVLLNLAFHGLDWSRSVWKETHETLVKAVENTSYLTLEALVAEVARVACSIDGANIVTVRAQKASADSVSHSSGVEITRAKSSFTS